MVSSLMSRLQLVTVLLLVLVAWFSAPARSAAAADPKQPDSAPKKEPVKGYEETILAYFKKPTDTASLLAYLKDHSSSDDDLLAIPNLIKQLGNDRFPERDAAFKKLVAIGLPALMPLVDATHDKDEERARLAKSALEKMDRGTHTVAVPAVTVNLLVKRQSLGLLETLLRYLPFTADPDVAAEICYAINDLAVVNGEIHPSLMTGLNDKLPARRAIAGCVVARLGSAEQRQTASKLLKDVDSNVQLRVAQGFLAGKEIRGMPALIGLLNLEPISNAWQAEELLIWAAGRSAPKQLVLTGGDRANKAHAAWLEWWKQNEASLDLKKVSDRVQIPTLFLIYPDSWKGGTSRIVGSDKTARWESDPRLRFATAWQWCARDSFIFIQSIPPGVDPKKRAGPSTGSRVLERTVSGGQNWVFECSDHSLPNFAVKLANGLVLIGDRDRLVTLDENGALTFERSNRELFGKNGSRNVQPNPYAMVSSMLVPLMTRTYQTCQRF